VVAGVRAAANFGRVSPLPIPVPLPQPATDTPAVRELCARLVPDEIPVSLKIDAPPWARPRECVTNVASVIEVHGGSGEHGWKLQETLPGVLLEAEFHVVWVDADGDRHDVTPAEVPLVTHSTFLPDPALVYEGRQIDNVRVALHDDPLIDDYIATWEELFAVMNRGELADYHGPVELTPEMRAIQTRSQDLEMKLLRKYYA
jgi:hypothetical protein